MVIYDFFIRMRILLGFWHMAENTIKDTKGENLSRLQLVGLAGVAERESSCQIVNQMRDLGVSVNMLTADSLPIAKNVAYQIGLQGKMA